MNKEETYIGKVRSVTGSSIAVELDERIQSTLPVINGVLYRVGQIGSFIKIPLGYIDLYGVVTQAGSDAIPESIAEKEEVKLGSRWIKAVLLGEKINSRFERGVIQYPIADDEVHLVTNADLEIIYGSLDQEKTITVGRVSACESLAARIDLDRLINRHCAVLGSTGSGKSNVVSIILQAIAQNTDLKKARIVLIDPHGEYGDRLNGLSQVFKINADISRNEKELTIPYWALPFHELMKIFPGRMNEQQLEHVRSTVHSMKLEGLSKLSMPPKKEAITADSPIPFNIKRLWFDLDDFERQTYSTKGISSTKTLDTTSPGDALSLKSNKYTPAGISSSPPFLNLSAKGLLGYLDLMRSRLLDQRYKFLFELGNLQPELDGEVTSDIGTLIQEWIGGEKPITILDLSSVPSEIMAPISGSILSIIYEFLYWGQNLDVGGRNTPTLFVLEEAHNYLKEGEDSIASRTIQKIAKEGRKYGSGLLLVTQRPSELDETVLSQCGSVIALRMTNSNDRGHIKNVLEDSLSDFTDLLPSLRTGEGLVLGEIVKLPMRTKFNKAKESKSTDPLVSEKWKGNPLDKNNYNIVINLWRNNTLNKP